MEDKESTESSSSDIQMLNDYEVLMLTLGKRKLRRRKPNAVVRQQESKVENSIKKDLGRKPDEENIYFDNIQSQGYKHYINELKSIKKVGDESEDENDEEESRISDSDKSTKDNKQGQKKTIMRSSSQNLKQNKSKKKTDTKKKPAQKEMKKDNQRKKKKEKKKNEQTQQKRKRKRSEMEMDEISDKNVELIDSEIRGEIDLEESDEEDQMNLIKNIKDRKDSFTSNIKNKEDFQQNNKNQQKKRGRKRLRLHSDDEWAQENDIEDEEEKIVYSEDEKVEKKVQLKDKDKKKQKQPINQKQKDSLKDKTVNIILPKSDLLSQVQQAIKNGKKYVDSQQVIHNAKQKEKEHEDEKIRRRIQHMKMLQNSSNSDKQIVGSFQQSSQLTQQHQQQQHHQIQNQIQKPQQNQQFDTSLNKNADATSNLYHRREFINQNTDITTNKMNQKNPIKQMNKDEQQEKKKELNSDKKVVLLKKKKIVEQIQEIENKKELNKSVSSIQIGKDQTQVMQTDSKEKEVEGQDKGKEKKLDANNILDQGLLLDQEDRTYIVIDISDSSSEEDEDDDKIKKPKLRKRIKEVNDEVNDTTKQFDLIGITDKPKLDADADADERESQQSNKDQDYEQQNKNNGDSTSSGSISEIEISSEEYQGQQNGEESNQQTNTNREVKTKPSLTNHRRQRKIRKMKPGRKERVKERDMEIDYQEEIDDLKADGRDNIRQKYLDNIERALTKAAQLAFADLDKADESVQTDDIQQQNNAMRALQQLSEEELKDRISEYANELENALYRNKGHPSQQRIVTSSDGDNIVGYRDQYTSLNFNLCDPKNSEFRRGVLSQTLSMERASTMHTWEMASQELVLQRKQIENKASNRVVLNQPISNVKKNKNESAVARKELQHDYNFDNMEQSTNQILETLFGVNIDQEQESESEDYEIETIQIYKKTHKGDEIIIPRGTNSDYTDEDYVKRMNLNQKHSQREGIKSKEANQKIEQRITDGKTLFNEQFLNVYGKKFDKNENKDTNNEQIQIINDDDDLILVEKDSSSASSSSSSTDQSQVSPKSISLTNQSSSSSSSKNLHLNPLLQFIIPGVQDLIKPDKLTNLSSLHAQVLAKARKPDSPIIQYSKLQQQDNQQHISMNLDKQLQIQQSQQPITQFTIPQLRIESSIDNIRIQMPNRNHQTAVFKAGIMHHPEVGKGLGISVPDFSQIVRESSSQSQEGISIRSLLLIKDILDTTAKVFQGFRIDQLDNKQDNQQKKEQQRSHLIDLCWILLFEGQTKEDETNLEKINKILMKKNTVGVLQVGEQNYLEDVNGDGYFIFLIAPFLFEQLPNEMKQVLDQRRANDGQQSTPPCLMGFIYPWFHI
ncbi:MAG: hypothetical protein EZS28_011910 [Streblomastix strix]|uniref:TFIIS central domain-containing protein n=1 Tax=Streblomastix strix TaxID=222440 RepID=A0A5J4WD01_9EUKA|nr:MAG: hypothetical protein EZS28_011910 [Streblomastix strix]